MTSIFISLICTNQRSKKMNAQFKSLFICLILLTSLPSCMVTKCRYSRGWNLGVNVNSIAKQDQKSPEQKQKYLKRNSIIGKQSTDSIGEAVSVKYTQDITYRRSSDSIKKLLVKNILNPQTMYSQVLKSKKSVRGPRIDKGDFVSHIQKQTELKNTPEFEEVEYESASNEWIIVLAPLVLGIIFLFIPALAVIGTWIVCIYAAIIYALIEGMFDFDLSWFTFFVQ